MNELLNRNGFPGKNGLFDPEACRLHQAKVSRDLVAGFQKNNVARNHLGAVDAHSSAVAKHCRARGKHLADGRDRLLGTALLNETDDCIHNDNGKDHCRVGNMPETRCDDCGPQKHIDQQVVKMREEANDRVASSCLG